MSEISWDIEDIGASSYTIFEAVELSLLLLVRYRQ
jgi:hypothetical protein